MVDRIGSAALLLEIVGKLSSTVRRYRRTKKKYTVGIINETRDFVATLIFNLQTEDTLFVYWTGARNFLVSLSNFRL